MDDLDALIAEAVVYGELSAGTSPRWLASQYDARLVAVTAGGTRAQAPGKSPRWTAEERQFIVDNFGWMTDAEIAQALGRTPEAVRIYRERHLNLTPRSADPNWPTAREVARMLGVSCSKTVAKWIRYGWLPARTLALEAHMWGIPRQAVVRFVADPENWHLFRPERVRDPHLRKIIRWRQERWPDAWWTVGQVAAYHGVTEGAINACISQGRLPAKRWGNWWVKRSDAVALRIYPGKGSNLEVEWSEAGDAWLVLSKALGLSYSQIAARNGWPVSRVGFRYGVLRERGAIPRLIRRHGLTVEYDTARQVSFADWRDYRGRVPRLALAMERFATGIARRDDLPYVQATLHTWAQWHACTDEQRRFASAVRQASNATPATLQGYVEQLNKWRVFPWL